MGKGQRGLLQTEALTYDLILVSKDVHFKRIDGIISPVYRRGSQRL